MPKINTPDDLPRIFDRAVRAALDKTAKRLSDEFDTQINTSKWPWDRGTTVRKNVHLFHRPVTLLTRQI